MMPMPVPRKLRPCGVAGPTRHLAGVLACVWLAAALVAPATPAAAQDAVPVPPGPASDREPAAAANVPGFTTLAASSPEQVSYEAARVQALAWLNDPGVLEAGLLDLAGRASGRLARARFQVAANAQGDEYCHRVSASLFVVQTVPDTIFICADTRWHVQQDGVAALDLLAQSFVHEAVHLAGTTDECVATSLEVGIARQHIRDANPGNMERYAGRCAADQLPVPSA